MTSFKDESLFYGGRSWGFMRNLIPGNGMDAVRDNPDTGSASYAVPCSTMQQKPARCLHG